MPFSAGLAILCAGITWRARLRRPGSEANFRDISDLTIIYRQMCYNNSESSISVGRDNWQGFSFETDNNSDEGCNIMCDEEKLELTDEIPVLFTDDVELLGDRLMDIIIAMGLPEEQTNAVLRLINDAVEDHHQNILDTFEDTIEIDEEAEQD